MSELLTLHRLDGKEVHIVKATMVEWYPDDGGKGTHITEVNGGFRIVLETVAEIDALYGKP
jgi:hypothetical protein